MRARFIGDPRHDGEGPKRLSLFGVDFVYGEWADVPTAFEAKIRGNNHFEVDADENGTPDLDADAMRAMLDGLGVKYHHKAGPAKLAELLDQHLPKDEDGDDQ